MHDTPNFRSTAHALNEMRALYPDISATTIQVFLEICMKAGASSKELMQRVDTSQSAISRHLSILADKSWRGGPGLQLIETIENPEDRRNKVAFLKPKGRELAIKLFGILDPQSPTPTHEDFPSATDYVRAYRSSRSSGEQSQVQSGGRRLPERLAVATRLWPNPYVQHMKEFRLAIQQRAEGSAERSLNLNLDRNDDAPVFGPEVAYLRGYAFLPGYVPGGNLDEGDDVDVFDDRSGHAAEAFHLLWQERDHVRDALGQDADLDGMTGVVHLERAYVAPAQRGRGLALHLMREAKDTFGLTGALLMLKAFPDGEQVTDQEQRKLAQYYQSDESLRFRPIRSDTASGWLIAPCG